MSITFINRESELDLLEKRHNSGKSEFFLIYGRRRVGKTELTKKFFKKRKHIYYLADTTNHINQLKKITAKVALEFNERVPLIEEWEEFFQYLKEKSKERLIFVIDEFPYLIKSYSPIVSIFQKGWDEYLKDTNIFLILLGSSMAMMKKRLLAYKSPLYGRRTGQMKIKMLEFKNAMKFYPALSFNAALEFYFVMSGIPFYLKEFDEKKSLIENISNTILSESNILFEEPEIILKEDLRKRSLYSEIFAAINCKAVKMKEISDKTGTKQHILSKYLGVLIELEYIKRENRPTDKKAVSKNSVYIITDNFFRFWYSFVYPNKSLLDEGKKEEVLKIIKDGMQQYSGKIFEQFVLDELFHKIISMSNIGRWWGHYRKNNQRKELEIDIVALDDKSKEILFAECKWKDKVDAEKVIKELSEKTKHVEWFNEQRKESFAVFAKSFSKKINKFDGREVSCFDLKDIEKILKR